MKKCLPAAAALVLAAAAPGASAQVKPEILVKQRQAAMTLQGKYFGPLGAMAQGRAPYSVEVVQRNAAHLEAVSKMPWDGFDPSTANEKSRTRPEAYSNGEKFKEAAERLQAETIKLSAMSKSGDEAAVKGQIGAVGKACGGCHETFREKQ